MTNAEKAKQYTLYLAVRIVGVVFGLMSVDAAMRFGRGMGSAWFYWPMQLPETHVPAWTLRIGAFKWLGSLAKASNKALGRFREHRLRAESHIRESFPDLPEADISRMAHVSMQQLCLMAIELMLSPRLINRWAWHDYVELRDLEYAVRALSDRRGCILLTGHYGNIEVLGSTLAVIGFDMTAISIEC
jgi:lauroyl/myristoyl acyltransferase